MSIRETEPTALPEDAEPETQPTPNFFIHHTPQPDPTPAPEPQADADTDADSEVDELELDDETDASDESESETVEAESEVDDKIATYDEPEPETAESEVDDEIAAYGTPESETAETEPEVDDEATVAVEPDIDTSDEVEPQAVTDGLPGHNGDGPAEPEGPHEVVIGGRPYLRDGGVFEERWTAIQTGFVDDPRLAVESADHLITEAIDDLAKILAGHRETLQAQWRDDVDTEQLRVVFRDYRAYLLGLLHT